MTQYAQEMLNDIWQIGGDLNKGLDLDSVCRNAHRAQMSPGGENHTAVLLIDVWEQRHL